MLSILQGRFADKSKEVGDNAPATAEQDAASCAPAPAGFPRHRRASRPVAQTRL